MGEHDCCKPDSHHKAPPQDSKPCPHSQFTPQTYELVDQAGLTAPVTVVLIGAVVADSLPASPKVGDVVELLPDSHPPPDLSTLNSTFRI